MADEWKILRNGTGSDAGQPSPDGRPDERSAPVRAGSADSAGGLENETPPVQDTSSGDKDRYGEPLRGGSASTPDSGTGTAMDRDDAILQYGERMHPSGFERELRGEKVPKKHFIAMLCVLGIVCLGWLFKEDVRGTAS